MEGDKETNKLSKKIVSQGQKKPTPRQKANQEKIQNYLKTCVTKMKTKQEKLMSQHKFGEKNNKFVLYPERNSFFLFDKDTKKVFFKAKFQIIGTYSEKSKTWRWGWSNRYVPYDLKQTALKIKKFGEANKVEILSDPKIKKDDMGLIFTALGMDLSKSQGYYIVPGTKVYPTIYLIFTQIKKINDTYEEVVSQMKANHRANHKLMRDKLKEVTSKKPTTKTTTPVGKSKPSTKTTTAVRAAKPSTKVKKTTKKKPPLQKKVTPKKKVTYPKKTNLTSAKIHLERSQKVFKKNEATNSNKRQNNLNLDNHNFSPLPKSKKSKTQLLIPIKTKKKLKNLM